MATLTLEHNYPRGNSLKALVDVKLLVNTFKSNETRIGEWINVIGYVVSSQRTKVIDSAIPPVTIQALVLWSAGPVKLDSYERCLEQRSAEKSFSPKST